MSYKEEVKCVMELTAWGAVEYLELGLLWNQKWLHLMHLAKTEVWKNVYYACIVTSLLIILIWKLWYLQKMF